MLLTAFLIYELQFLTIYLKLFTSNTISLKYLNIVIQISYLFTVFIAVYLLSLSLSLHLILPQPPLIKDNIFTFNRP